MTQDEIIRMAREAGFEVVDGELRLYFDGSKALLKPNYMGTIVDGLKEFAALVAAHERERTKDLTDDEIEEIRIGIVAYEPTGYGRVFARAVIAADREKNK